MCWMESFNAVSAVNTCSLLTNPNIMKQNLNKSHGFREVITISYLVPELLGQNAR